MVKNTLWKAFLQLERLWVDNEFFDKKGWYINEQEFNRLSEDDGYKIIKRDWVGSFLIATVWIGKKDKHGNLFKTTIAVLVNYGEEEQEIIGVFHLKYEDVELAEAGHEKVRKLLLVACEKYHNDPELIVESVQFALQVEKAIELLENGRE